MFCRLRHACAAAVSRSWLRVSVSFEMLHERVHLGPLRRATDYTAKYVKNNQLLESFFLASVCYSAIAVFVYSDNIANKHVFLYGCEGKSNVRCPLFSYLVSEF